MRREARTRLHEQLALLRKRRRRDGERRNILRVLRSDEMQDELAIRVKRELKIDVNNVHELLKAFAEFAPQLLKIIADVIAFFR